MSGEVVAENSKGVEYIKHPLLKENAVEGRPYQALLFSNIIKHNSLVVAPTGTGKSVLALLATIHTLQNFGGLVIILAPTLALIDQHTKFFRDKTTFDPEKICSITGKTPPNRRKQRWVEDLRIVISTPETLAKDIQEGFVKLNQCHLLIIDEAHRNSQEYKRIMNSIKQSRASGNLHRILGMSATIPESKLLEIMNLFDLEHIEIQIASDPEVANYTVKTQIEPVIIPLPETWHQVIDELRALRAAALRGVSRYHEFLGGELHEAASRSALIAALDHLKQQSHLNSEIRAKLSTRLAAAIKLDHALDLFSRQGKTAFLEFANRLYKESSKTNKRLVSSPRFQKAIEIVSALDQEHPKTRELLSILEKEQNAETILVFSKSKQTVFTLSKILKEQRIPTNVLVGKRDLSEKDRRRILENFKSGKTRVLVSSVVGEEGLDLGCDLVIFYDAVASVISHVQRKGRLRKHGKVLFLLAKDTADEAFHYISRGEEQKMNQAFRRLKSTSKDTLHKKGSKTDESQQITDQELKGTMTSDKKEDFKEPMPLKRDPSQREDVMSTKIVIKIDPKDADLTPPSDNAHQTKIELTPLSGPSLKIDQIAIFRFKLSDLLQELSRGTLLPKLMHSAKTQEQCVIILEEYSLEILSQAKIHMNAIFKTIWSIVLDLNISVIPSNSTNETKQLIEQLIKHQESIKEVSDLKTHQEKLMTALPGVSTLLAKRLLAAYSSPLNVFKLSNEQLQATSGIGKEKSQTIHTLLNSAYENSD